MSQTLLKTPPKISFSTIDLQTLEFQFLIKSTDDKKIPWLKLTHTISD